MWFALIGAVGFWCPDVIQHALRGQRFSGSDVLRISYVCPVVLIVTYGAVMLWTRRQGRACPVSKGMLAGIWALGPAAMVITGTFNLGVFASWDGFVRGVVILAACTVLCPIASWIMATYDGSLLALMAVSVFLSVAFAFERRGKLVSPETRVQAGEMR